MCKMTFILLAAIALASCERSSRTVEIVPTTNNVNGNGNKGDGIGGSGSLALSLDGLPSTSNSASLSISVDGGSSTATVNLVNGAGKTIIGNLSAGKSQSVIIKTTISNVLYISRINIDIAKDSQSSAFAKMAKIDTGDTPSGDTPGGGTPGGGTPSGGTPGGGTPGGGTPGGGTPGGGTPSGGTPGGGTSSTTASIDVTIDIGGQTGPSAVILPPGSSTGDWDGLTFKGNAQFDVSPSP